MNREEATQFGFPNGGTGMFEGLYYDMIAEVSREHTTRYGTAPEMTEDEKFISFLNRYFIFRKVRHVAAEKITKLIEDKMPSLEASKCTGPASSIVPVIYGSPESKLEENEEYREEEEEGIGKIAKTFDKREQIATKERMEKERPEKERPEKERPEKEQPEKTPHFIRPIENAKITIRTYEPPHSEKREEENKQEPVEIQNIEIAEEQPAIKLVPKTVRIGKTVRVPKVAKK